MPNIYTLQKIKKGEGEQNQRPVMIFLIASNFFFYSNFLDTSELHNLTWRSFHLKEVLSYYILPLEFTMPVNFTLLEDLSKLPSILF